jgi:hypothetical protein
MDDDCKLPKRIVKFSGMQTPHIGIAMFNVAVNFTRECNIEDEFFVVTLHPTMVQ